MPEKLLRLLCPIRRGICLDAPVKCRMHRKHMYEDSIVVVRHECSQGAALNIDFIIEIHPSRDDREAACEPYLARSQGKGFEINFQPT